MLFREFDRRLGSSLVLGLPGAEGQLRMSPRPRFGWRPGEFPPDCRQGGVLLLVYPIDDQAFILLTVRDSRLPHHPGQVSLPGGAVEQGETLEQAALREAHEEVGLDPTEADVRGALTPLHVPVSRYVLHPFVATSWRRPHLVADQREVARIVEAPLDLLQGRAQQQIERRTIGSRTVDVPYFALDGEKVWGATAMVLSELLCLLESPPNPWPETPDRGSGLPVTP